MLGLFVYGTLKRGFWNHERFCRGVLKKAVVRGRLYTMPAGIPVLQFPPEEILAIGTADPRTDIVIQARFVVEAPGLPLNYGKLQRCALVYGERLTFADPATRLPVIDRLEGFEAGGPSLYQRVLVPVSSQGTTRVAWLYVAGSPLPAGWRVHRGGVWL